MKQRPDMLIPYPKPSLEVLNSLPVFGGAFVFTSIWQVRHQNGTDYMAVVNGSEVRWPSTASLISFVKSRNLLFEHCGLLIIDKQQRDWEPAAQLILTLSREHPHEPPQQQES
jgi:hypothetical protein